MQRRKPLNTTDTKPHYHSPTLVCVGAARFYAQYVCVLPVHKPRYVTSSLVRLGEWRPTPGLSTALYRSTRRVDEFRPDSVGFTWTKSNAEEGKRDGKEGKLGCNIIFTILRYAFPKKSFDRKSDTRHNSLIMQVTGRKMKVRRRIVSGHKQRSEILGGPQRKIYPPRMWRIYPGISEGSSSRSDPMARNRTCLYNGNGTDQYDDGLFPLKRIFTALFSPYSRAVGTREPSASLACSPRCSVRQTITKEVLKLTESSTIGRQMTLDFSSQSTQKVIYNVHNFFSFPTEHHALLLLFCRTGTSREHWKIVLRAQVQHVYDLAAASAFIRVHEKDSPLVCPYLDKQMQHRIARSF
ncbi:hypothetical protein ALC53_13884 [Atta colombica]|uniref:Uncharacterized protein n=1 Tax=Atta colombica TaxID=520822 RepID=A0A195AV16_9HYME|nr:hypothetical protein ALC53_13884 [Atta colombica]